MNTELKYQRMMQIAANILYKNNGDLQVEKVNAPFWDLLVTNIKDGYTFAVSVKSSIYNKSIEFEHYCKEYASNLILNNGNVHIPVLLMCVNESDESALVCQMLYLRGDNYVVNDKPTRRTINAKTWPIIEDNLRRTNQLVFALNQSNWKIKKTIAISVNDEGRNASAHIIYLRDFSQEYKMHQKEPSDNHDKIMRLIKGTPEDEYPSDRLDEIIFRCFEKEYGPKNVSKKSDTMFFSTDLNKLEVEIIGHKTFKCSITICPDLINCPQPVLFEGISLPEIKLDLFVDFDNEGYAFHEQINTVVVSMQEYVEQFIRKELNKTIHTPFEFII